MPPHVPSGLEFHPSTPQHQPTGAVVALAVLMAASSRQRVAELEHREILSLFPVTPQAQYLHQQHGKKVRRQTGRASGWRLASRNSLTLPDLSNHKI